MIEKKQEILMKNNKMIKARYNLNVTENKIFQLILFEFQKHNQHTLIAEIPKKKIETVLQKNDYTTKKGIDGILTKLFDAEIHFNNGGEGKGRFINNFQWIENDTKVRIKADAEIYAMIYDYLKGYTPINLPIFLSFKSFYTQRMYEILRLWSNTKVTINYSIEELRDLLKLDGKHSAYCDLKKRIINPSIKELNEKALMKIDIKEHKQGRKVVSIDFIVTDNDKRKYFEEDKKQNKPKENYPVNNLKFNNFDQRDYDYDTLEKQLLGWETD